MRSSALSDARFGDNSGPTKTSECATIHQECAGRERHFYVLPVIRPNRTRRHMVNLCAHKRGLSEKAALTGNPCELTNEAYTMLGRIPFRKPKEEILEIGRASCRERV